MAAAPKRDRDRAYRLRRKRAQGKRLSRKDSGWLRSYTHRHPPPEVAAERRRAKEGPRKALPRRDRDRAYRLRRKLREGKSISAQDGRWLKAYKRRTRKSRSTAREDALDLGAALGAWLFGEGNYKTTEDGWSRPSKPGDPGVATVTIEPIDGSKGATQGPGGGLGSPDLPPSSGRAAGVRVRVDGGSRREEQWATVGAFEDDWDLLADDLGAEVEDIADSYGADGVGAIVVFVN